MIFKKVVIVELHNEIKIGLSVKYYYGLLDDYKVENKCYHF